MKDDLIPFSIDFKKAKRDARKMLKSEDNVIRNLAGAYLDLLRTSDADLKVLDKIHKLL